MALNVREKGPCDTLEFFQAHLGSEPLYTGLMLTNLGIWPFREGGWIRRELPTMANLATLGRWFHIHGSTRVPEDDLIYTVVIGELLAPCLNAGLILDESNSKTALIKAVKALIYNNDMLVRFSEGTRAGYIALAGDLTLSPNRERVSASGRNIFLTAPFDTNGRAGLALPEATDWPELATETMTPAAAIRILWYLSKTATTRSARGGLACIVHIVVAIVKRGTISAAFRNKIVRGIYDDLGKEVEINMTAIPMIYKVYGGCINETNIQQVFERWGGQIPDQALRLRLTVQQAAGGGITGYSTIVAAIRDNPDFCWARIKLMLPEDWVHFETAYKTVGNDKYYGFRRDLGPAKSTLFKNLCYVAKELRIKVQGESALAQYQGWTSRIPHQAAIDRAIAEYETARSQNVTDDAVQQEVGTEAFKTFLDIVKNPAYVPEPTS